jgi:hypothetical protein
MRNRMSFGCAIILMTCAFMTAADIPASAQGLFDLSINPVVVSKWEPEPWPEVPFSSLRLWDAHTAWQEINTAEGVYDWTFLDAWLNAAHAGGQHVLYTFGQTPRWASSNPNDNGCAGGPGTCDPPDDLNPDGSGPDQHWKDFVTALALRSKNSTTAHIEAWEIWNEPFATWQWTGTFAQMVRMASDAAAIIKDFDPHAVMLSPSVDWAWGQPMSWLGNYFAAGGTQYADPIAVHGYVFMYGGKRDEPEDMVRMSQKFRAVLKTYGQDSKPIWDTEGSWRYTKNNRYNDPDMQAGWLARFYLLHRSNSIKRLFWYSYNSDDDFGTLWIPDPKDRTQKGTLLKPGIAFAELNGWLVGASMTAACSPSGTIWSCGLSRTGGYQGLLVWDTSKNCSYGKCQTQNYTVNSQYINYRTLDGQTIRVTRHMVPIGAKPILVQNQ